MPDHYDALETRDPAARERELFARLPEIVAARDDARRAGRSSSPASIRNPSPRARRWPSCRCCASPICCAAKGQARRSAASTSRRPARRSGCSCRPARSSSRRATAPTSAARRARCSPRASARATSCTTLLLSSDARRLHPGVRRARARLRRHPRRRRQHRAAARRDRAFQAGRLHRHAGLPENPARYRGQGRQGRLLDQARAGLRRGAAGLAARRSLPRAASRCCNATPSPSSASIAYESERAKGMIVNETVILEIVRPGTGDPVADGEVGEVVVTSFNPDYPMIRLATGDLSAVHGRRLALRPHQHAHQGLDGPRRPDHQGQGHVRAARSRSPRSPSAIRRSAACGSWSPARPSRTR